MEETLTSLLSGVCSGRRYWGRAPQTAERPFLVLQRITKLPDYTMRGASGFTESRVQIDCYADTYTAAKAATRDVQSVLSGYRAGDILGIFLDGERDLPASDAGEVTHLFRIQQDFLIHEIA